MLSRLREIVINRINVLRAFFDNNISLQAWLIAIPYVVSGILSAIAIVIYSKVFQYTEQKAFALYNYNSYIFLIASPILFYLAWLVVHYGAKAAGGSGIPQIMASLKLLHEKTGVSVSPLLSVRVIFVKVISSCLGLLGGSAIGREGPSLQISASLYMVIQKLKPKSWPTLSPQKMILAGGAAGLAAAFNTPLGGIVFAIEELSKTSLHSFRSSLLLSVILAGLATQWLSGPYLYLGYPHVGAFEPRFYVLIIIMSLLAGMAGALKSRLILRVNEFKRGLKKHWHLHLFVAGCGLALAVLIIVLGRDVIGSGKSQLQSMLFSQDTGWDWRLVPARFLASLVSFTSGMAGGVFAPSLSTGAGIGAMFSHYAQFDTNNKIIVLCGMVAFLTGVTRAPFTSAVLVLEMTDRHSAIFPMMLAAMVANTGAAMLMKKSLYDYLIYNYLPADLYPARKVNI